jgi:hypothetical protein
MLRAELIETPCSTERPPKRSAIFCFVIHPKFSSGKIANMCLTQSGHSVNETRSFLRLSRLIWLASLRGRSPFVKCGYGRGFPIQVVGDDFQCGAGSSL